MAKSNEPIWWSLFGAGGMVAALLMPITVALIGLAVPFNLISERSLFAALHHPLIRLYLFLLVSLSFFHAAHRTRFTLIDIGMKGAAGALAVLFYGGAIVGTVLAALLLLRM
jgi:fumarate reductase subunit D